MRVETYFKNFEQFAELPDAVGKIRELVLLLAMRGKLVARKQADGNASELFSDTNLESTPSRFEVAKNWIWVRFSEVGEQRLGKMLDKGKNRGELKPYLRNTNVQWMQFRLDDIKEFRLEPNELEEYRLLPGDLLICEGGEPGRCAIWREPDCEMYFQKAIHRVRPRNGILAEYIAICLQADARSGVLAQYFTGATIKHLTGRSLKKYPVPVPPLAEQKRIVAKVDELMALCDQLEGQQQERKTQHAALARASLARFADAPTPANLEFLFHPSYSISPADLRKAILTLAVQGKLVRQDPNDESASNLLQKIASEKNRLFDMGHLKKRDLKEFMIHEDDKLFELPVGWAWARWGTVALKIGDVDHKMPQEVDKGIPYVSPRDFRPSNKIDFADAKKISHEDFLRLATKIQPEVGDLIYPRYGTIGENRLVEDSRDFLASYSCAVIKTMPGLFDAYYQFYFSLSELCRSQSKEAENKTTQANVGLNSIKAFMIPVPPLAEQRRIVAKVDQLMTLVDELEAQLAKSQTTAKKLLAAVVAELTAAPHLKNR